MFKLPRWSGGYRTRLPIKRSLRIRFSDLAKVLRPVITIFLLRISCKNFFIRNSLTFLWYSELLNA